MSITKIHAREILDSRGNPTVEVDLFTSKGKKHTHTHTPIQAHAHADITTCDVSTVCRVNPEKEYVPPFPLSFIPLSHPIFLPLPVLFFHLYLFSSPSHSILLLSLFSHWLGRMGKCFLRYEVRLWNMGCLTVFNMRMSYIWIS